MTDRKVKEKIFWSYDNQVTMAEGGYFYRVFGLRDLIDKIEKQGKEVIGIRLDENPNNIEILTKKVMKE